MSIEIQFSSVTIEPSELQEHFPNLISTIYYYLPKQKYAKRRRQRRKKKTAAVLIDDIIDSIEGE